MTVYGAYANFAGVSQVTSTLGPNDPEVGQRLDYGDESYIFVYNAGNSSIPVGKAATVSAVTGYSVTVSSITAVDFAIGVCKHAAITTGAYGWLLKRGFTTVQMGANDSAAAGQGLCLGIDGTLVLKTQMTAVPTPVFAKTMEAIASGGSGMAYVSIY